MDQESPAGLRFTAITLTKESAKNGESQASGETHFTPFPFYTSGGLDPKEQEQSCRTLGLAEALKSSVVFITSSGVFEWGAVGSTGRQAQRAKQILLLP